MSARILVAGPPMSAPLMSPITDELRRGGHQVTLLYSDTTAFRHEEAWRGADLAIWYGLPCGREEMALAPGLRAIISPTIGYEWIDLEAATALDILVVNGEVPENYQSMAEAAVMLILASLYDLHGAEAELRGAGKRIQPRMLRGKTLGLVGYGNIAQCLVQRLENWAVRLLAHTRTPRGIDGAVEFTTLERLLRESDVVVLLASLNEETRHMINAERLALMKRDAVLINLARGALIDEEALARHVAGGNLSKVALDVFETEPLPQQSPLRALPNAILTPHSIGHTRESFDAIPHVAVANAALILAGEAPQSTRNRMILERWAEKWSNARTERPRCTT